MSNNPRFLNIKKAEQNKCYGLPCKSQRADQQSYPHPNAFIDHNVAWVFQIWVSYQMVTDGNDAQWYEAKQEKEERRIEMPVGNAPSQAQGQERACCSRSRDVPADAH